MAEDITSVLSAYPIKSKYIKHITDLLYYIDVGDQAYALKKSTLSNDTINQWQQVYDLANHYHFSFVLPVMLTRDGNLFVMSNDHIYYMTPWINHKNYSTKNFYRSLGKLHAQTKRIFEVNIEQIEQNFTTYKETCQQALTTVLHTVQQFERQIYMSPFELQVCTHYRHIEHIIEKLISTIDQFVNEIKSQREWSYSLCHGNLQIDHIVATDNTYLINWEQAHFDHALTDLTTFFKQSKLFSFPRKSFITSFSTYLEENELTISEHLLLCIYLLDPAKYVKVIQQYNDERHQDTMINYVKALEQAFRQLLFGLQWIDHYEQEINTIFAEDDS